MSVPATLERPSGDDGKLVAIDTARELLRPGEELPESVRLTIEFFLARGIWFLLSRNDAVSSCRDAASRRYRLGHKGIPLADELRSYLATATTLGGSEVHVLFHCRGNASFDFAKVERDGIVPGHDFARASMDDFDDDVIGYGLVNPFLAPAILESKDQAVTQVFDEEVFVPSGETGTMMTNAGDRTWAVEFRPIELLERAGRDFAIVASIAHRASDEEMPPRTIGILTGNAPESGALLWGKVNHLFRARRGSAFRGDASYPRTLVHSLPAMGWSMELAKREDQLRERIIGEVDQMVADGVGPIAFACNTTQYFADVVGHALSGTDANFVALPEAVGAWLSARRDKPTFIAGIGAVTDRSDLSAFADVFGRSNVILPDDGRSKRIERLAYQVKQEGVTPDTYQKFRRLIINSGADHVLLVLTELSMIFERYPRSPIGGVSITDSMDLYAAAILDSAEPASARPRPVT